MLRIFTHIMSMGVLIAFPVSAVHRHQKMSKAVREMEQRAAEDCMKASMALGVTALAMVGVHLLSLMH